MFNKVKAKLNYQDSCNNDTDCYLNSQCFQNLCICKPGFQFKRGLCGKINYNQ